MQSLGELDGIVSFCEMAVPLVARLAEKLGVPGNTPASIDAARDKHCTRSVMQAAKLPSPRNQLVTEPEDVEKAAAHVGFPAGVCGGSACSRVHLCALVFVNSSTQVIGGE